MYALFLTISLMFLEGGEGDYDSDDPDGDNGPRLVQTLHQGGCIK
jgi:hypothetical protein